MRAPGRLGGGPGLARSLMRDRMEVQTRPKEVSKLFSRIAKLTRWIRASRSKPIWEEYARHAGRRPPVTWWEKAVPWIAGAVFVFLVLYFK